MNKYSRLVKQIILFGLVGGTSLLIDICVTTALYDLAHLPPYLAGGIGFLSAFFFNFPINRKHVFSHTKYDRFSMKIQIMLYASLSLLNLIITATLTQILVDDVHLQISLAKICVAVLIALWNFFIFKYCVFSKRPQYVEIESLIVQ